MFAFVFEGVLFEFEYARPAFASLFAFPPNKTALGRTTLYHTTGRNTGWPGTST